VARELAPAGRRNRPKPTKLYSEKVPGLFVFLGATPTDQDMQKAPNNHSPYFTVDDATLATGVKAHVQFVLNYPGRVAEKLNPSG
jgi:metal-dependent amidase/aminoacylase/carboxypeptidase family protein